MPYHLYDVICAGERPTLHGPRGGWSMENKKSNDMLIDAISLTICKNEEVPTGPDDDEYMDYITGHIFLNDPTVACHDESSNLVEVCKAGGDKERAGGFGLANRRKGVELLEEKLLNVPENGVVCHVKGTSKPADGHSFSIIAMPGGNSGGFPTVQVMEGWAKPGFFTTMCNRERNFEWIVKAGAASNRGLTSAERAQDALTPAEAAEIVKGFVDEDENVRTRAYQYFTRCGYRAINFECKDNACRERAPDDEIGLEVFCSDMAPESVIRERMESRRVCARGYIHRTKELKRKYS